MKRFVLCAMTFGAFAACSKTTTKTEEPDSASTVAAEAETPQSDSQASAPQKPAVAAAPTPEPKQYAPAGVYFLREATKVETDAGITGLKRGTQLTKGADGKYTASSGETLTLSEAQVTNELGEVRRLLAQEKMDTAALAKAQAQAVQAEKAIQRAAATPSAPVVATAPQQRVAAASSVPPPRYVAATPTSSVGATHSATKRENGFIWKKNANGEWVIDHLAH